MAYLKLDSVCVDLPIYDAQGRSMKKQLLRLSGQSRIGADGHGVVVVRALDELSFALEKGDRVGLIGRNGAGKSTLLRVLAGIYEPTAGRLERSGKAVPLLDISLGMDENSTGYQNIRLRGLLLGMEIEEIGRKTEEIAEFTELSDYLDLPIRTYSSGMKVRLAFAISTAVDADILLLDEVIGTGDAAFIHKANRRLREFQDRAKIVVVASHSNAVVREMCNKALWLEKGKQVMFGPVDEVVAAYEQAVGAADTAGRSERYEAARAEVAPGA